MLILRLFGGIGALVCIIAGMLLAIWPWRWTKILALRCSAAAMWCLGEGQDRG